MNKPIPLHLQHLTVTVSYRGDNFPDYHFPPSHSIEHKMRIRTLRI